MEKLTPVQRLIKLIVLDREDVVSIYFYAILSGLVQLSVPIGVQAIIGFVLGASMVTSIYVLIVLVVLGVLAVGVMQINQMKIIEKIQQNIFARYAFDFAEKTPKFDLLKSDNYYLPEKLNRFFDTLAVQKGLSKILLDVPAASIQILFGLILLALYHPFFIVFGLLLVGILWVILKFTSRRGLSTSIEESTYKYEVVAWLQEMARVIKSFKFSQGTHLNLQKMDKNVTNYLSARTSHFKVLLLQYKTLVAFKVIITTTMLTVGSYLLIEQQLNIGEFIAAEIVILTVIGAVEKLISSLDSVYDVVTGLEKLASVTENYTERDGNFVLNTNETGLEIRLLDFSFDYPDKKRILNSVNLTIPANSLVCISGDDGAGKTTLLEILSRNYSDFDGSFLLNDIPIHNYRLESIRSETGVYLHSEDIFVGTVWENISMGRQEVTPEKIVLTAQNLGIHTFLKTLANGFETKIDPVGRKLPSTMIKNILLLRAFSNKPNLLLLEEPWLGLENVTKDTIIDYLFRLKQNSMTTVIVASNDTDFAQKCDFHYLISNGSVELVKK